jgi:predicted TIM-barrel fold metal-dependent hydrolase
MYQTGIDKVALMPSMVDPLPEPPSILTNFLQLMLKHKKLRSLGYHLCANFNKEGIQILFQNYSIYPTPDNKLIFDIIDQHPDKFLGWIFINPASNQDVVTEISKWIDHPNCAGIKAHPFWHRYAPSELIDAAKLAEEKNKPMLIHCGFNAHGDYLPLIKAVPELKLILAHAAFPRYRDDWQMIQSYSNVFVDLSQTAYVNKNTIQEVVKTLGWQRCLFGTDGPYGSRNKNGEFCFNVIKSQIESLFPDMDCQKGILGTNFERVLFET